MSFPKLFTLEQIDSFLSVNPSVMKMAQEKVVYFRRIIGFNMNKIKMIGCKACRNECGLDMPKCRLNSALCNSDGGKVYVCPQFRV